MSANCDFVTSHERWFSKVMISPEEINDRLVVNRYLYFDNVSKFRLFLYKNWTTS